MTDFEDRAQARLRRGESIEGSVSIGTGALFITSQRLLAFVPEGDGPTFQECERLNVDEITVRTDSDRSKLRPIIRRSGAGLAAVYVGYRYNFGSFVPTDSLPTTGTARVEPGDSPRCYRLQMSC